MFNLKKKEEKEEKDFIRLVSYAVVWKQPLVCLNTFAG